MKIFHVLMVFEDQFSFAKERKITTVSEETFEKMKKGVGTTFRHFDKKAQIAYNYKVLEVRQATPQDYHDIDHPDKELNPIT